jgi:NADH:ubiquinone oxidoreductase subunit E
MEEKKVDLTKLNELLSHHREERWSLIPLLQEVQQEYGYIPREVIEPIAKALKLFPSQVQGVITFYAQFSLTPRGRNVIRVCRGTACHVKGGKSILKIVKQHLKIDEGETAEDLSYTLDTVACLGTCFLAPVMMVNRNYFGKLSPPKVSYILSQFK